jgi:hypothetical protein
MKKVILTTVAVFLIVAAGFGQAIRDRNVIPVAVNLNQVLRMTITNGGNIEFVFNTIDEYKNGIDGSASAFYQTNFTVSSSTKWKLTYGAEDATFIGTDNPANTLALDNVGLGIGENGAHGFEAAGNAKNTTDAELFSTPTDNASLVTALQAYPVDLIEDNDRPGFANGGDAGDNDFTLTWYCGTSEAGAVGYEMNTEALIDQLVSPTPDRYQTNVIFELTIDN